MSETVFTFLIVAMLAAALRSLDDTRAWPWRARGRALRGDRVRYAALAVVPESRRPRRRLAGAPCRLARGRRDLAVALIVGPLVVAQGRQMGFDRLGEGVAGRSIGASRDSSTATASIPSLALNPSASERRPCTAATPTDGYDPDSPAVRLFGGPVAGDDSLDAWARRAIVAQPLDYVSEVLDDLTLFVDEQPWTNRNYSLIGPRTISFTLRSPDENCSPDVCRAPPLGVEGNSVYGWTAPDRGSYYAPFEPRQDEGVVVFQDLQRVLRVHGPLLGLMAAISLLGLLAIRDDLPRPSGC